MKSILLSLVTISFSLSIHSQTITGKNAAFVYSNATEIYYSEKTKAPVFISLDKNKHVSPQYIFTELKSVLKMRSNIDSWRQFREEKDDIGFTHQRYQQYYKNVKVETGEYIIHSKDGFVESANGYFYNEINISVIPAVPEYNALQAALKEINASVYKWQLPREEAWLKESTNNPSATFFPEGELVIVRLQNPSKHNPFALAWKFDIYAHEPMSRNFVFVDAITGKLIEKQDRICEFIGHGTAVTMYNGTQAIITDSLSPTSYRLRDYSRGGSVQTYNLNHGTNYGTATDFTDSDNLWNTTANQDHAAYDAHFGAQMTYDFYLNVMNRNSYDNAGAPLKSYVHYSSNYNNAFWNGSVMTYGDGSGTIFSPLTQLDVCGHELSHGVTEFTSGLVYSYESGALNESFSDILGTCVEFFAYPATANFLLGEQCYTPATPGDALRFMNNPNLASDPDTYLGTYWYSGTGDNGGVHTNSGVQNFWFYLLASGGTGTNDVSFNYNVTGIGVTDASKIAYRSNSYYLTSGSQYADARINAIKSAADLFGPCSAQMIQTANAWDAVGVTGFFSPNPLATASNSGVVCEGNNVQLTSSGGTSFVWSGPSGFSSSAQNPLLANTTISNAGTYTVIVTDANGCSGIVSTVVALNQKPAVSNSSSSNSVCSGTSVFLTSTASAYGNGAPFTTANTNRISIPDANNTGILSPMTVTGSPATASQVVSIEIDSISHTWDGDLILYLIAPNGSQITLANGVGGSGDAFSHTIFSATANNVIGSNGNNTAPFQNTYAPQQSFASLTGTANGSWKVKVVDAYSQDTGSIWGWKINLPGPNSISTYSWNPSSGLSSPASQNTFGTIITSTIYTLIVGDTKGCTSTATVSININPDVAATSTHTDITCNGSQNGIISIATTSGTAPFLYSIDGGSYQSSNQFSGLGNGMHSYSVTDVNGCNTFSSFEIINEPSPLSYSASIFNPACFGNSNGSIDISVGSGYLPYSYQWSDGNSAEDRTALQSGTYTVTATDAHGCTVQGTSVISIPSELIVSNIPTDINCYGASTGSINLTTTGGVQGYSYFWNDGAVTEDRVNIPAGNYSVLITDNNGCTKTSSAIISEPTLITINSIVGNVLCKNSSTGSIDISPNGGSPSYTYLWSNNATSQDLINIPASTYNLTITDSQNCTQTMSIVVIQPALALTLNATKTNVRCGGKATGLITLTPTGGTNPYVYLWNTGSTSNAISSLAAGTFTCTVTDAVGCIKIQAINVTQNPPMVVLITPLSSTSALASVSGGVGPFAYLWNTVPAQTNATATGLSPGTQYKIKVTDNKGCSIITLITMPASKNGNQVSTATSVKTEFKIYPNPNNGLFQVEWFSNTSLNFKVELFSVIGNLVDTRMIEFKPQSKYLFDYSILPKGIYLMRICNENISQTERIVIE